MKGRGGECPKICGWEKLVLVLQNNRDRSQGFSGIISDKGK